MRFFLTNEYMDKPIIPPPFVIINPLVVICKRIFVACKHMTESECSQTEVRRKKRETNSIGLRPQKIHLLTLNEVHLDRQRSESTDIEGTLVIASKYSNLIPDEYYEPDSQITEEGDYCIRKHKHRKPACPQLAVLCGKVTSSNY